MILGDIYTYGLFQPLYNALVYLYNVIPGNDMGVAIIVLTLIVKMLLAPMSLKTIKAQKEQQKLQPELEKIKEKYKDNREQQSREIMRFYREK